MNLKSRMRKWLWCWMWTWIDLKKKFRGISFKRSHRGKWAVELPFMRRRRTVTLHEPVTGVIGTLALGITNLLFPAGGAYAFFTGLTTALTYMGVGAAMWGASSLLSSLGQKKPENSFARGSLLFSTMTVKDESYCRNSAT